MNKYFLYFVLAEQYTRHNIVFWAEVLFRRKCRNKLDGSGAITRI